MTVDVGAVAARGRTVIESAIRSSGTRVDIYADPDDADATVDFDTLEVSDLTPERATLRDQPVLLVSEGAATDEAGPNREQGTQVYRVLFLRTVVDVPEGAVLIPRRCPDSRLVNARLRVTDVLDDPLATSRPVLARRLT